MKKTKQKVWPKTQVLAAYAKGGISAARRTARKLNCEHKLKRWAWEGLIELEPKE